MFSDQTHAQKAWDGRGWPCLCLLSDRKLQERKKEEEEGGEKEEKEDEKRIGKSKPFIGDACTVTVLPKRLKPLDQNGRCFVEIFPQPANLFPSDFLLKREEDPRGGEGSGRL